MPINWGLAQNGAQNALAQGYQLGSAVRERKERAEFNALRREELEYRRAEREDAKAAAAQKSGIEGLEGFRPLLEQAAQGPEQYAMAYKAGADAGYDMSRVPTTYDPDWVQGQLRIIKSAEDGSLPGIAKEVMFALGIDDPNDERVRQGVTSVINSKYASDYVDEAGNTRRRSTLNLGGQVAQTVSTPEEAAALPPGTRYRTPDGQEYIR